MEILGRKFLLLVLLITQQSHAIKSTTFENAGFGDATNSLSPLQSTPYAEMTNPSDGMSYETSAAGTQADVSSEVPTSTFSSISTEETGTPTPINKVKSDGIVSNAKEMWAMTSPSSKTASKGETSSDDVDKVEKTISHRNDPCMDQKVRNTGDKSGITSLRMSDNVFVRTASYSVMAIGTVSTVFNILNIMVYCKRSTASATLIIVLSIVDVLDCSAMVIREISNFAIKISRGGIVNYVWNNCRHFLRRASHTLNMVISLDRFLVLSREVNSRSIIQMFPKRVTGITIVILFCLTFVEAVGLRLSIPVNMKFTFGSNGTGTTPYDGLNIVANSNATLDEVLNATTSVNTHYPDVDISELSTTDVTETFDLVTTTESSLNIPDTLPPKMNVIYTTVLIINIIYTYVLFALIFIFNIAAIVFLKRHAAKRKRLGVTTDESKSKQEERKQSAILITMTTVYVVFALPVSLLQIIYTSQPCIDLNRRNALSFAWVGEIMTTGSDFFVFLIMSSSFRKKLSFICLCKGRPKLKQRVSCAVQHVDSNKAAPVVLYSTKL